MNFFDKCKHLTVMVGDGSGVIYQPQADYSYILTAKHNLEDEKNIKIIKYNTNPLNIQQIYKHKTLDIAIIKIDRIESPKILLQVNVPKYLEKYKFYGYPITRRDETKIDDKIFDYDLRISSTSEENYNINVRNEDSSPYDEVVGFSGGGLLNAENIDENAEIYLAGIECKMDIKGKEDEEETHNRLRVISIKAFDEVVEQYRDELVYLDDSKSVNKQYSVDENIIDLGNGKSITMKTVPVWVDGKVLNVSIYPVTFAEYDLFCDDIGYEKKDDWLDIDRKLFPVVNITWEEATEYCHWLNNYNEESIYKLPSSKEWESIASQNEFKKNIWCNKKFISKIGTNLGKKGIYDFLGNVEEICEDQLRKGASYLNQLSTVLDFKREKKITMLPKGEVGFRVVCKNKLYRN